MVENDRFFIDSDGTLHFAYLTMLDAKNYSCSLVLEKAQAGQYGPFFKLKVFKNFAAKSNIF